MGSGGIDGREGRETTVGRGGIDGRKGRETTVGDEGREEVGRLGLGLQAV